MLQGPGALGMAILTRGLGMTTVEIEELLVDVRKEVNQDGDESIRIYAPM